MNSQQWKDKTESVYADKGKAVSATAQKCIRAIAYAELYPTSRNVKIAESNATRLAQILADVESSKPAKMTVHLNGESILSEERIKNAATRYYELNVELSRVRESLTRRMKELELTRNSIEANIPHAQGDEFKNALREMASLFGSEYFPDSIESV